MHVKDANIRRFALFFHKVSGKLDPTLRQQEGFILQTLHPTLREFGHYIYERSCNALTRRERDHPME